MKIQIYNFSIKKEKKKIKQIERGWGGVDGWSTLIRQIVVVIVNQFSFRLQKDDVDYRNAG